MVSIRCKMVVKAALKELGLSYCTLDLGVVDIKEQITAAQRELLKTTLASAGLELMDDKKAILIENIKNVVVEMIHYAEEFSLLKNSQYISDKLNHNYTYLANLFSEATGTTIEHFIIMHKIEKVKELLLYDELNLTEISYKMHYSSVAHLSNQFKKVTGLTPSFFKKMKELRNMNLESM